MKTIKPKNLTGDVVFVKPYEAEATEGGVIIPKNIQSKEDASPWYEITKKGEDATKYDVGNVVLVNPYVIKRTRVYDFGLEDEDGNKVREAQISEKNILGEADFGSQLEV